MKKLLILLMTLPIITFGFHSTHADNFSYDDPPTLFDDFSYPDTDALSENGWTIRTVEGWPGMPDAVWWQDGVTLLADPDDESNRLIQISAATDGTTFYQVQLCQQRKFLEGTYASRVYFTDEPITGPDGDNVVQTFYMISPLLEPLHPDYSEMDFEYLPNGGWGIPNNVFFTTTWETFHPEPEWFADNISNNAQESFAGWHVLVVQVLDNRVKYYLDGEVFALHTGKFYPEVPMSLNYNLWFIRDGQLDSDEYREYIEQIDWVYFAAGVLLHPDEVETRVTEFRNAEIPFTDTVPAWTPDEPIDTCNL